MRISDWSSDVCSSDLIDSDLRLARPAVDRCRDVEAHRPEIGVIARADAGAETQVGKGRDRATIDLTRVDATDNAHIAETIAHLDGRLLDAAATERVHIRLVRPQFFIPISQHRTHAPCIPTPTRP